MLAAVRSAAVVGIDAVPVVVEVDASTGLPQFTVVGLAAAAVKESRERVCAAVVNSGFELPNRRVIVNLSPADLRKEGTGFDVAIALGLLVATNQLPQQCVDDIVAVGELALDGTVRPVRGILSIARHVFACDERRTLVVPPGNAHEAALVTHLPLAASETLWDLVEQLRAGALQPVRARAAPSERAAALPDIGDVVGQEAAKRAVEICAGGDHGVVLVGPPGGGKTLLARCIPSLLPALTEPELLQVIAVHSVAGTLPAGELPPFSRPFRAPHHTISTAGLVGGGSSPRPGEASLAHVGVLFLDEMLEFPRVTLDALRQPMEDGQVVIARAAGSIRYPARFTLVGAMNPCPCGRAGSEGARPCVCTVDEVRRYRARLSGPLTDRIDMHVTVGATPVRLLGARAGRERSATVRARVERARERQRQRYRSFGPLMSNGRVPGRWLELETPVHGEARSLLVSAAERLGLSARAYHRVLRVARTIADLDGAEAITAVAVAEALRYRPGEATGSIVPQSLPTACSQPGFAANRIEA